MTERPLTARVLGVGLDPDTDPESGVDDAVVRRVDGPADARAALDDEPVACAVVEPGGDGADWDPVALVGDLCERAPDASVVLVTDGGLDPYVEGGVVGALDAVVRPGEPATLADAVAGALERVRERATEREAADRYRALVDGAPVPVCVLDAEGTIRAANDALATLLGADAPAALVGRHALEFVATGSRPAAAKRLRRVVDDREPTPAAQRTLVAADGTEKYVVAAMQPVSHDGEPAAQAVLTDVTEHKRLGVALREQRDRFSTLFENLSEPVVATDFEADAPVVTDVNEAFVETFGYEPGVAVGEPLNDLVVPEGKEDEAQSLDERVRAGERLHVEIERETTDGSREFLFRNIPVETEDRPVGYAVYVDITDQKERERQLRERNDRLNEFASVIGHDLRNPMGAVRHRIEMGRQTGDDRHLDDALSALDRMDELLRDLLQMARQGEELGETEPVSLAAVANTAWDHIATGESSLVVTDDATVVADRGRLTQLLENLFINAVEHGSTSPDSQARRDAVEHGSTTSQSQAPADAHTDPVEVRVGVADGCIVVEDDGRGIPAANRQEVFESGFSTSSEGTGYGLAIVRQVARAHDWEAAASESAEGGARFEFHGVEFVE